MEQKSIKKKNADAVIVAAQDSKTPPSAEEQKNIDPQDKKITSEENNSVDQDPIINEPQDASEMSVAQIIQAMQEDWKKPEALSKQRENVKIKISLVTEAIKKLRTANKPTSSLDKRIKTIETPISSISTDEKKLNELKIISLETELVNLREKNEVLWERFVAACGSERAALQFEKLLSQVKSKRYHRGAGYYIKNTMLQVLNKIIENDKAALIELKKLADAMSDEGIKVFNEKVRELLHEYDDKLVVRCSYYNRDQYHSIFRLTLQTWDPSAEAAINELVVPAESE